MTETEATVGAAEAEVTAAVATAPESPAEGAETRKGPRPGEVEAFLHCFCRLFAELRRHPLKHPVVEEQLIRAARALHALLARQDPIVLTVAHGGVFLVGEEVPEESSVRRQLKKELLRMGIGAITFRAEVEARGLQVLAGAAGKGREAVEAFGGYPFLFDLAKVQGIGLSMASERESSAAAITAGLVALLVATRRPEQVTEACLEDASGFGRRVREALVAVDEECVVESDYSAQVELEALAKQLGGGLTPLSEVAALGLEERVDRVCALRDFLAELERGRSGFTAAAVLSFLDGFAGIADLAGLIADILRDSYGGYGDLADLRRVFAVLCRDATIGFRVLDRLRAAAEGLDDLFLERMESLARERVHLELAPDPGQALNDYLRELLPEEVTGDGREEAVVAFLDDFIGKELMRDIDAHVAGVGAKVEAGYTALSQAASMVAEAQLGFAIVGADERVLFSVFGDGVFDSETPLMKEFADAAREWEPGQLIEFGGVKVLDISMRPGGSVGGVLFIPAGA